MVDHHKGEHSYADNPLDTEPDRIPEKPVTMSGPARSGTNTDYRNNEHSGVLDRPVTVSVTAGPIDTLETLGVHGPTVVAEKPDLTVVMLLQIVGNQE